MFVTDAPVVYPTDPDQEMWNYEQGTELRDPTGQELAGYYTRLASWYVDGGFPDENGVVHASGYHYQFPVWEVLNEPDGEHNTTPQDYTLRKRNCGGCSPRQPEHQVHGARSGGCRRSELYPIFSQSGESPAGNSYRLPLLPFLCSFTTRPARP